jgi:hypothetical protein
MPEKDKRLSKNGAFMLLLVFLNALILKNGFIFNSGWYLLLIFSVPLLFIALNADRKEKEGYNS